MFEAPKATAQVHVPSEDFALANRHVLDGVTRIAAQRARLADLRFRHQDTKDGEILLSLMEEALVLMKSHQEALEAKVAEWRRLQASSPRIDFSHSYGLADIQIEQSREAVFDSEYLLARLRRDGW